MSQVNDQEIVQQTAAYVQQQLAQAEGGHDWWHIYRVWQTARTIAQQEQANLLVVELAALLHDIADAKFHQGNEELGPQRAMAFLQGLQVPVPIIEQVVFIMRHISFRSSAMQPLQRTLELNIVQDADRLDAMGAIGIARAFSYGGFAGRKLYDPAIAPQPHQTPEQYKKSNAPTINHFYEKLLLLKDGMHTQTGRQWAQERHAFMEQYLQQFFKEWQGGA